MVRFIVFLDVNKFMKECASTPKKESSKGNQYCAKKNIFSRKLFKELNFTVSEQIFSHIYA